MKQTFGFRLNSIRLFVLMVILFFVANQGDMLFASEAIDREESFAIAEKKTISGKSSERKLRFDYTDEDLMNVVYYVAEAKGVNIIVPREWGGANKLKISLHISDLLSLDDAWKLLQTIVDMAGYALLPQESGYVIVKREVGIKSPTSLYIGVKPNQIPDSDEMIRYLYYLSNIKLSEDANNEIKIIMDEILPAGMLYKPDLTTNALLLTAKASSIRDVMRVILELDQSAFQERMMFLELHNTQAAVVAQLFNENILNAGQDRNRYRLDTRKQPENSFFSPHARIIPVPHRNALIILGRSQAIERIQDFIQKNIDIEAKAGKSILHTYQLQYLDAESFSKILEDIIERARSGGTGQSYSGESTGTGVEREFDQVIIKSDRPSNPAETGHYGNNILIVACRNDDWGQIKKLIEDMDQPQPQVLLEVLIADLTLDDTRLLGSLTRNPSKVPIFNRMQFQSAQLALGSSGTLGVIPNMDDAANATTVAGDLLRNAFNEAGDTIVPSSEGVRSAASFPVAGSTLISLSDNDGETWSILQILNLFVHSKVLSHPHVVAVNNKKATIEVGEQRYLPDEAAGSASTTTRNIKPINADLKVYITPRISSADTVTLAVEVVISDFIAGPGNQRTQRSVKTTVTLKSKTIFALGGLVRLDGEQGITETPGLSKIPILGWLFKKQQGTAVKNNLTVFISPTIIQPRFRQGLDTYTTDYLDVSRKYAREGNSFDTLTQPVSRWFFKTGIDLEKTADEFVNNKTVELSLQRRVPPPPEAEPVVEEKMNNPVPNHHQKKSESIDVKSDHFVSKEYFKAMVAADTENPFEKKTPVEPIRETLKVVVQDDDENPFVKKTSDNILKKDA